MRIRHNGIKYYIIIISQIIAPSRRSIVPIYLSRRSGHQTAAFRGHFDDCEIRRLIQNTIARCLIIIRTLVVAHLLIIRN